MSRRRSAETRLQILREKQRRHFLVRARQRFGLELTDVHCAEILARIERDKPGVLFLGILGWTSAWRVRWRKTTMVVLFDHHTNQLATCFKYKAWRWNR